ncbi:hypothetical protein GXW71_06380 [Roseomonas hellenica]|uniref:Uncharacterized protein n=1 Tax=Plastoroseomonas hellenica TaxID=2687306 RepID=A0ABS5EUK1_9PROT|nr:hypothetical protein [Plastoroseomonas hellenica]MBR0663981.1 hypothetical protein [Plastoroseomonas hellenica]
MAARSSLLAPARRHHAALGSILEEAPFEYVPRTFVTREHPLQPKADPNDWLHRDADGNPVLFAAADEVPEGVELSEPIEDGETVPLIAVRRYQTTEMQVVSDGTYSVPGTPPESVNWFQLHEACGASTLKRLAELMVEEGAVGSSMVSYFQRAEVTCLYNGEEHSLELMDRQASMLNLLSVETVGRC